MLEAIEDWEPPPKDKDYERMLAQVQQTTEDAMFDASLVNPHLSVKSLKLKLYRSLGAHESALCTIYNSGQKCRIPCEFREVNPSTKRSTRVALHINDVHVGDGEGLTLKDAKNLCADNCLKYLKKKGMMVISPSEIDEDAVTKVGWVLYCSHHCHILVENASLTE